MKRLALVTAAATAGFAAAIVRFTGADTSQGCVVDVPNDSSYAAKFDGLPTMDETNHTLDLTQNGRPVTGAHVCINTWMKGMSGMAMTAGATEQAPGKFNVPFQFVMGGPWQATVIVTQKGGTQSGASMSFEVGLGAMPSMPSASPGG